MTDNSNNVQVIGGGLAGTEATWQIARSGIPVTLYEMRPLCHSPAHHSQELAELVCSNSFGAMASDRASGLLHENRLFHSPVHITLIGLCGGDKSRQDQDIAKAKEYWVDYRRRDDA